MNVGLVVVISIVALLLVVAGALFWWVNRPLQSSPAAHTLPLFGSDIVVAPVPITDEEDDLDTLDVEDRRALIDPDTPTPAAVAAAVGANDPASHDRRAYRFAPPPGQPGVISRVDRNEQPPEAQVLLRAEPRADMPSNAGANASTSQFREDARASAPQVREDVRNNDVATSLGGSLQGSAHSFAHTAQQSSRAQMFASSPARPAAAAPPVARPASAAMQPPHRTPARPAPNVFEGQSVRFSIPTDGTLQFLPGRLEMTAGHDVGREIRFVRLPDPEGTRVTFGRLDGPLYRHVQLHDPTVSRMHASMHIVDGEWQLTNLSTTNPVVYNNRLLGEGETLTLADGDRVEMGEVVFRFRNR